MGLVGWWPLHTTSGKAVDLSGNGNHGTVNGASRGIAGKGGLQAMSFDGSNDYINTGYGSGSAPITICCWVYHSIASGEWPLNFFTDTGEGWGLYFDGDQQVAVYDDSAGNDVQNYRTYISRGEWHHICATIDKNNIQSLYVNGDLVGTGNTVDSTSLGSELYIGARQSGGGYFTGGVFDAKMYDRALTPSEISELHKQGGQIAPPEDGVSRYEFEGDVTDSWHSNDGTNNGATFTSGKYGQAASFDGSSDYIDSNVIVNSKDMAVAFWVYRNGKNNEPWEINNYGGSGQHLIISTGRGTNNDKIGTFVDDSKSGEWLESSATVASQKWEHVVVSYDSSEYKMDFYLNGDLVDTVTYSGGKPDFSQRSFYLGKDRSNSANYLNGRLDDVRFYDRNLKSTEVKALYHGYNDLAQPPGASDSAAVSRYKFDDSVNSTVIDSWGSNDGTDETGQGYAMGVRGKSKVFPGSDDKNIVVGDIGDLGTEYSVSAWAITNSTSTQQFIVDYSTDDQSDHNNQAIQLDINNADARFKVVDDTEKVVSAVASGVITTNSWFHLAGVREGNNIELYVNGKKAATASASLGTVLMNHMLIGALYDDEYDLDSFGFDGEIDDVRIYSRALKPWEIHELYRWGTGGRDMRKLTANARSANQSSGVYTYPQYASNLINDFNDGSLSTVQDSNFGYDSSGSSGESESGGVAQGSGFCDWDHKTGSTSYTGNAAVRMRVTSSGGDVKFILYGDGGRGPGVIFSDSSGTIIAFDGSSNTDTGYSFSVGTWYEIEFVRDNSAGTYDLYINGEKVVSGYGDGGNTYLNENYFRIQGSSSAEYDSHYLDT